MRGQAALKAFMAEHKICEGDLLKSRFPEHTVMRQKAIKHLRGLGYGVMETARVMKISQQCVRYWTDPDFRADRNCKHGRRNSSARKFKVLGIALEALYG
jgi:hypothetical protein